MAVNLGSAPITGIRLGTTQVARVYLGTTLVWNLLPAPVWTASVATVTVTATSGTWTGVAGPITWTRSVATVTVTGTSGSWLVGVSAPPTGLAAAMISATSTLLSWNAAFGATSYVVEYRAAKAKVVTYADDFDYPNGTNLNDTPNWEVPPSWGNLRVQDGTVYLPFVQDDSVGYCTVPCPVDGYAEATLTTIGIVYAGVIFRNSSGHLSFTDLRHELCTEMTRDGYFDLVDIWETDPGYEPEEYVTIYKTPPDYYPNGTGVPVRLRTEAIGNVARMYIDDVLKGTGYIVNNLTGSVARTGGWRGNSDSHTYIHRFEFGAFAVGPWTVYSTPTGIATTVAGLVQGNQYDYRVAAVNANGQGPFSASISHAAGLGVPTITGIAPSSGVAAGGTAVVLTGTGFAPDSTFVTFDGGADHPCVVKDFTTLDFTSPAHTAATVSVRVRTPNGLSAPITYTFTGSGQTWFRSVGGVGVTGVSAVWSVAPVPPAQTWTGSTATVTLTGTSGTWSGPAMQFWTRSIATVTATGTSGTWSVAPLPQTWTASTATVTVSGTSGVWVLTVPGPDSVANLIGWYDASNGATTSTWTPRSSYGPTLAVIGSVTLGTLSGLTTVNCTGSGGFRGALNVTGDDLTVFMVTVPNASTAGTNYIRGVSLSVGAGDDFNGNDRAVVVYKDPSGFPLAFRGNSTRGYGPAISDTNPHIITSLFNGTNHTMYTDGVAGTPVGSTGTFASTSLGIGTTATTTFNGDYWQGQIAEVVIYDRALDSTERAAVWAYLNGRWFTPLPQIWVRSTGAVSATATSGTWSVPSLPGAPTLTVATPGNTTVALTWTAPVITGGTITGYLVEKSANGTTGWSTVTTTGAVLTYTVTGLTNETIQYFRVSAINAVGTGSASNVLSATPTAASGTTITDTFDGTGALTGWSQLGFSAAWTRVSGVASMNSEWSFPVHNTALTTNHCYAQITCGSGFNDLALFICNDGTTWPFPFPYGYVLFTSGGTAWEIRQMTAGGANTTVATGSASGTSSGAVCRIEHDGAGHISAYRNGALVCQGDATIVFTDKRAGFGCIAGTQVRTADNFSAGDL